MKDKKLKHEQEMFVLKKAAHDIRSPLTTLNFLRTREFFNQNLPETKLLFKALEHIQEISNDIMKVKKESQQLISNKYKTLLIPIICDICSESRFKHEDLNTSLNYKLQNRYAANINPTHFKSVFTNIINNAIEACHNKKNQLKIRIKEHSQFIEIKLKDNGCGLSASKVRQIFKEGMTFNKLNGQGIGLYSTKKYLKSIGGEIKLTSQLHKGSEVIIQIPKSN